MLNLMNKYDSDEQQQQRQPTKKMVCELNCEQRESIDYINETSTRRFCEIHYNNDRSSSNPKVIVVGMSE